MVVHIRAQLLQKFGAIAFGAGCCLSIWVYGKENQEIFALPVAFWLGVYFWPDRQCAPTPNGRRAASQSAQKEGLLWAGAAASWLAAIVGMGMLQRSPAYATQNQMAIEAALSRVEGGLAKGDLANSLATLDRLSVPKRFPMLEARRTHDRGLILLRLGRTAEASESLLRSLKHDSNNVEAACLLSENALSTGDLRAARLYLDKALAVNPSYDFAKRLSSRLNQATPDRNRDHKP